MPQTERRSWAFVVVIVATFVLTAGLMLTWPLESSGLSFGLQVGIVVYAATVAWSAILLTLAGVVSTAVLRQVRPSDEAEKSFQAWVAAEAGVEDMRARLAANGDYWKSVEAYNANPVALQGVLGSLAKVPWKGRRIAVLGDMLELGPSGKKRHGSWGSTMCR